MKRVAALEDLVDGVPTVVDVGSRELVLIRRGGVVYAARNVCPHQRQSFECGLLKRGTIEGNATGDLTLADEPVLACPWHGYGYRLRDGRCISDRSLRIRVYPVKVEAGDVFVDLPTRRTLPEAAAGD